jgi:hypothetical protein
MTTKAVPDTKRLKDLYAQDDAARAVLDHLAGLQRNRKQTTVDRLLVAVRQGGYEDLTRGAIVQVLKRLEELECGTFITGRWGHASRFQWDVNLTDVGRAASGEETKIEPVSEEANGADEDEADILGHTFRLRPDVSVTLELPADLSQAEASRLAEFVKTLPFNH